LLPLKGAVKLDDDLTMAEGKLDITNTANEEVVLITNNTLTNTNMMRLTSSSLLSASLLRVVQSSSVYVGTEGLLSVQVGGSSSTGPVAVFTQKGTGNGVFIDHDGNGIALNIDSEANAAALNVAGAATTVPVVDITATSTSAAAMVLRKGTTDGGFFNFVATADADTTSAISTLTTSGAIVGHVQVELNGTKQWLAVLANPS